jgi:hypothetical protein
LTFLGNIYVWYGCGSISAERQAALQYAQTLGDDVVELSQGEEDDGMFWIVLGDDDFASADYWKWRPQASDIDARIWQVDSARGVDAVGQASLPSFHTNTLVSLCR